MNFPRVFRNADKDILTVVGEEETESFKLVEKDSGEDRMPKLLNSRYIKRGMDGIDYYNGWKQIVQGDSEKQTRLPVGFRTKNGSEVYVELVYHNRTEIYKRKKNYPKSSEGRIWEELDDPESYYKNNGFREVAP